MLAQINRLRKKNDFAEVFKNGKEIRENCLVFKYIKNNLKENRFGVIISKKTAKKAVLRNKLKRRIRAVIFKKLSHCKKGFDGVFLALSGLEKNDFLEIEKTIDKIFQKSIY